MSADETDVDRSEDGGESVGANIPSTPGESLTAMGYNVDGGTAEPDAAATETGGLIFGLDLPRVLAALLGLFLALFLLVYAVGLV